MDKPVDSYGEFWKYLSQPQRDLILEGQYLMNEVIRHNKYQFKDYSFLIFPYAKAYEGYLKQLFKDIKFISHLDYISDHFRLGKVMSPNLTEKLGDRSLYKKMSETVSPEFADRVWSTWKLGRNQIFHYFAHNLKSVSFEEAENIINEILKTMEEVYTKLQGQISNLKTENPNQNQNPKSV